MAVVDFIHCDGLAFSIVESPRLMTLIKIARLVGNDFEPPSRRQVSDKLHANNYKSTHVDNDAMLMDDAETFGLAFLGDGATIKKLPLINVLAMPGTMLPIVLGINDCSEHLAGGGGQGCSIHC